ncbi:MAG: hypothetical protein ACI31G_03885 [Bacilli bacterium]
MIEIYNETILNKEKKKIINYVFIMICVSLILLVGIILLSIFAKKEFKTLFIVLLSVILFLFLSTISVFLFYIFYLRAIYIEHKNIYENKRSKIEGKIKDISKNFTIVKNIEGYELLFEDGLIVYVDLLLVKEDEFHIGDYIVGYSSLNFLVSYSKKEETKK